MFVEVLLILLSKPILLNAGGDEKHCHQYVDGEFTCKLSHSLAGKIAWYWDSFQLVLAFQSSKNVLYVQPFMW